MANGPQGGGVVSTLAGLRHSPLKTDHPAMEPPRPVDQAERGGSSTPVVPIVVAEIGRESSGFRDSHFAKTSGMGGDPRGH